MRRRRRLLDELDQDIRDHLAQETQDNIARGMSPDEAGYAALRKFGNITRIKEDTRAVWYRVWLDELAQDLRYGLRQLRRSPGFALVAILTLALGIGATSTIFSWIDETLLNPIPDVSHASQYVEMTQVLSYPDYVDLRNRTHTFSALVAGDLYPMELTGGNNPQNVWGVLSTVNYFDGLGVKPILGRGFLPEEGEKPDGAPVMVLSYHLWESRFGGRHSVIGRVVQLDKHPYTVIGVAPPGFVGTHAGLRADLWVPAVMLPQIHHMNLLARGNSFLLPIGRLKPGVTRAQARADLNVLRRQIARQYPDSHRYQHSVTLYPLWRAPFGLNNYMDTILLLLFAVSGVVLLLACANVANLLLVRSIGRGRELAIRLSIGASRGRLVRQLLVESLILASCAGGLAMLFTLWTARLLGDLVPASGLPIAIQGHADGTVLLATLILSLITSVIFGIVPALRSSALEPIAALKEGSGGTSGGARKGRLSGALVVAQVAMSLLLLIAAGLFVRSIGAAQRFNPGFNPRHVLLSSYDLRAAGYNAEAGIEFDHQLLSKLDALPGVRSATLIYRWRASWGALSGSKHGAATQTVPLTLLGRRVVQPEGYLAQPHEDMDVQYADVAPGYFQTLQIPLIAGRSFSWSDTAHSQLVTIVSQQFAKRYWPGQHAIGKRLQISGHRWFTVVGVARDSDYDSLGEKPMSFFYLPLAQSYYGSVTLEARTAGNPLPLTRSVEHAVHALDPDVALYDVSTMDSRMRLATTTQRLGGTFVGGFGLVALILAAIGIYGVLAYSTRQRTHEIGVRMALGAEPRHVCALVLAQGARLAALGIAIGLAASLVLTRVLSSALFGVSTTDPLTYAGVALVLCAVSLLACYLPARRAMQVDPMVALRHE